MKVQKIKCPSCEKELKMLEKKDTFFCMHCGIKLFLDGEEIKLENTDLITKEETKKELGEYLPIVIYLGVMITFILLCVGMTLFSPNGKFSNEITIPNDYKYYKGKDYEEVIGELKDVGFENITTKKIEDLVTGWITKDGEVEKVSINGSTEFKKDDIFKKDSKVVVSYHTFEKKKK